MNDIERLMRQSTWLQSLAATLVGDGRADDLVQETWLEALRAPLPPAESGLRAWLRTSLRRNFIDSVRVDDRRRRRESSQRIPRPSPATDEVLLRAQAQRRIVEAVLELDEVSRSCVLLRYFDDQPPRAIAQRLDMDVEAVRSRLKRALAQLRLRLEADRPGPEGRQGLLLLAALALPRPRMTFGLSCLESWP